MHKAEILLFLCFLAITLAVSRVCAGFHKGGDSWQRNSYVWCKLAPPRRLPQSLAQPVVLPPAERRKMKMGEVQSGRFDLDGKIVKVFVNVVTSIEPLTPAWSRVSCGYDRRGELPSMAVILVPEQGKDFFTEILRSSGGGARTVYIRIRSSDPVVIGRSSFYFEAVGTRYSRTGNEYRW